VSTHIDSPANPTVKGLAGLHKRRHRDAEQRYLVEGRREVERAVAAGVVEQLLISPDLGAEIPSSGSVLTLSEAAFARLSVRRHPDGYAAVAAHAPLGLDRIAGLTAVLVAEAIEKPGNLGAMLRTAEALDAGMLLADPATDLFNPNVVRASQGSLFTVPIARSSAREAREWLEERMQVVVARPDGTRAPWEFDLVPPTAVVVGAEHAGVSSTWSDTPSIAVPMGGTVDSLNTSVAAAIVLYELRRQRS